MITAQPGAMKGKLRTAVLFYVLGFMVIVAAILTASWIRSSWDKRHSPSLFYVTFRSEDIKRTVMDSAGTAHKMLFVNGYSDATRGRFYWCEVSDSTYDWAEYADVIEVPISKCRQLAP